MTASRAENESEYFLIVRGGTEVEEPEARAVFTNSLADAWASLATRSLGATAPTNPPGVAEIFGRWTEPMKAPTRGDVHFRLENGEAAGHTIVVPGLFRKLEAEILAHADHLGLYRLNLAVPKLADVTVERREQGLIQAEGMEPFLSARAKLFAAIREQHDHRAKADEDAERFGIVETADSARAEGPSPGLSGHLPRSSRNQPEANWASCFSRSWMP